MIFADIQADIPVAILATIFIVVTVTGIAIALAMDKLNSSNAERFFNKAFSLNLFAVKQVITDNGSEFKGQFSKALAEANIKHYHTYARTPKMNAICERFNRTLQE